MTHSLRSEQLAPKDQGLKSATREAVHAFGGQAAVAARVADVARSFARQQRVSDCCLPNVPDFLSIQVASIIEDETHGWPGHPHITRAMARRQGFVLVPIAVSPPESGDWLRLIGDLSQSAGATVAGISTALGNDGVICPGEARDAALRRRAVQLLDLAGALLGAVEQLEQGPLA